MPAGGVPVAVKPQKLNLCYETYEALYARICGKAHSYGYIIPIKQMATFSDDINSLVTGCRDSGGTMNRIIVLSKNEKVKAGLFIQKCISRKLQKED